MFSKELQALGAIVDDSFGEECTHLIWNNGKSKRFNAAIAMEIKAVSPLWVEQCKQAKKYVSELDFPAISNSVSSTTRVAVTSAPVPVIDKAGHLRSLDSPTFSSSQREAVVNTSGKRKLSHEITTIGAGVDSKGKPIEIYSRPHTLHML